jgi:hypothetical protein
MSVVYISPSKLRRPVAEEASRGVYTPLGGKPEVRTYDNPLNTPISALPAP